MQTRRKFLRDCSLVAVSVPLIPAAALGQSQTLRAAVLKGPGLKQFAAQLKTVFQVRAGSTRIKMQLIEATGFSAVLQNSEDARNEKFVLRFGGPLAQPLGQGTYVFEHVKLGRQSIFIVPIGTLEGQRCIYEAIFDRPVHAAELAAQVARAPKRIRKN